MERFGIRVRQYEGQARGLILRDIGENPQIYRVTLIPALNGHRRVILIMGTKAVGGPVETVDYVECVTHCLYIQGKSGGHQGAVLSATV